MPERIGFPVTHPVIVLWGEFLKPLGVTQTKLARDTGMSYLRVNELLNGKRGFTPDTALRVSKYLGTTAEMWLNWQAAYDLQHTEKIHRADYRKIRALASAV
ncbi:MAG: HigA family addiction module antidote protein [Nitrospinae bacterium]|nr:HigA family addiction module antidote protein [Nitrospinota bacterium]